MCVSDYRLNNIANAKIATGVTITAATIMPTSSSISLSSLVSFSFIFLIPCVGKIEIPNGFEFVAATVGNLNPPNG